MKLLSQEGDRWVFHLARQEQRLLVRLLGMLGHLNSGEHPLGNSRTAGDGDRAPGPEVQELLTHSLEDHRRGVRRQLAAWLADPTRLVSGKGGYALKLTSEEIEVLLQGLGEVRVGNWLAAGAPDFEMGEMPDLDEKNVLHLDLMELAGMFQAALIDALGEEP